MNKLSSKSYLNKIYANYDISGLFFYQITLLTSMYYLLDVCTDLSHPHEIYHNRSFPNFPLVSLLVNLYLYVFQC